MKTLKNIIAYPIRLIKALFEFIYYMYVLYKINKICIEVRAGTVNDILKHLPEGRHSQR